MRNRTAILAAATVLALLVTGLAWAASDTNNDIASSETNVAIATGQEQIIPVDSAGSVVLLRTDTQLQVLSVIPNPGYTPEIEVAAGREVEVDLRGEGRLVKFNAELEDGQVRVRIEIEDDSSPASTGSTGSTASTASTSSTSSTSTTVDDRSDDDDDDDDNNNAGSGSDDDDDNSPSGSDDNDSDDDNSGGGSSGVDNDSGHDDSDDDDDNSGGGSGD